MAIGTPVQRYSATAATTTSHAFSPATTIAAGTLAVMEIHCGQSKIPSSVTDSVGNTWTVDANASSGTSRLAFVSCQVATQITSSDTITITWSVATSANCEVWVYEVSSAATSAAFDQAVFASQATAVVDSGNTGTLANADSVVFGISRIASGSRNLTPDGSYSQSANPLRGSTAEVAFKVVAATTAVSYSGTWSGADANTWTAVAVYKGLPGSTNATVAVPAATLAVAGPTSLPTLAVPSALATEAVAAVAPLPILSVPLVASAVAVAAPAPAVTATRNPTVVVPVATVALAAPVPVVSAETNATIVVPVAAINVAALLNVSSVTVGPSKATIAVAALAPVVTVAAGTTISVPVATINVAAYLSVSSVTVGPLPATLSLAAVAPLPALTIGPPAATLSLLAQTVVIVPVFSTTIVGVVAIITVAALPPCVNEPVLIALLPDTLVLTPEPVGTLVLTAEPLGTLVLTPLAADTLVLTPESPNTLTLDPLEVCD